MKNIVIQNLLQKVLSTKTSRPNSLKQNTLWMVFGNTYYAICQWLILVVIAHLGGPEDVGIFTLALAVTAPVITFCALGLRAILASDIKHAHDFTAYFTVKVISACLGFLICLGIAAWYGQPSCWTIIVIALAKTVETISEMYYGYAQQAQQLNRIATSLILRGTISTSLLALIYAATHNLTISVCAYSASWVIILFLYDRKSVGETLHTLNNHDFKSVAGILKNGLPMGITSLMLLLGQNAPRYILENNYGASELGIFASMAYFITVGNIPVMALCQSLVPILAHYHEEKNLQKFNSLIMRALFGIFALGLCGVAAAYLIGDFVLNLVYGSIFAARSEILPLIATAAAISYIGELFRHMNAATKIFAAQAPAFLLVAIVSFSGSLLLIPTFGLSGAAYTLIVNSITACSLSLLLGFFQRKLKRK